MIIILFIIPAMVFLIRLYRKCEKWKESQRGNKDDLLDEMGKVWSETLAPLYDLVTDLVRSPSEIREFLLALEPYPRIWKALRGLKWCIYSNC